MKTALILMLCFIAGLLSWWSLERASAAAWVRTEWNAAISGGGSVTPNRQVEIMRASLSELAQDPGGIVFVLFVFQAPTLAAGIFKKYSGVQYAVLATCALLMVGDLGVAAAPGGGDFKGCTKCDGSVLMNLAFASLATLASLFAITVFVGTRLFTLRPRSRSTRQSAADRREGPAPVER